MPPHGHAAFAPGRVNLIGEHTDYNDGLCLPFAIEQGVLCIARLDGGAVAASPDPELLDALLAELRTAGIDPPACRIGIESSLRPGAGLASSAALAIAIALVLCAAAGAEPPEPVELARLCSRVEHRLGAETGLLDQLASLLGAPGEALRLDMRTLEVGRMPLELGDHVLAVLDSGAPRALAASGYNERRAECRRAAELLGIESLRDATPGAAARLPAPLDRRVRHVITENARVDAAVEALGRADTAALGRLLDDSHTSLRDDYEVSVLKVERTVRACKEAGALGARIMGGGFGGSVLALFPPNAQPPRDARVVRASAGARLL